MSQFTSGCYAVTMYLPLHPFCPLLISLGGWASHHQRDAIDYLEEETLVLGEQLGDKRLRYDKFTSERFGPIAPFAPP